MVQLVALHFAGDRRPRPHHAHIAAQHIDQLRQLIQRILAQETPRPRDARIIGDLEQLVLRTGIGYNLTENNNNVLLGFAYKKDTGDTTAAKPLANGKERKRKRRKSNESKAAGAETTVPLATHASRAGPLAEKPKQKKRKSEGNA